MQVPPVRLVSDAIKTGQVEEVRRLFMEHPNLVSDCPWFGGTWLSCAAETDNVQMVAMLVTDFGFDVNGGHYGPLSNAAYHGSANVARWLLDHGARVDTPGENPRVPLASAATAGRLEIARMLLEHGADPNVLYGTMEYGDPPTNALKQALMFGHKEVAELLREYGAVLPPGCEFEDSPMEIKSIQEHIEARLGRPEPVSLQEIVPGDPQITVHVVRQEEKIALVTVGMSDRAMTIPAGGEDYQFAELVIYLPPDWPLDERGLRSRNNFWPIEWLRRIGHYPHDNQTWLGGRAAVIANGDPPRQLASNTKMTCVLAIIEESEFGWCQLSDGRRVGFYTLIPLYTEERDLEKTAGVEELLLRFGELGISPVVDLHRPNVALE